MVVLRIVAALFLFSLFTVSGARADVVVRIDKADQRMAVVVDGVTKHSWVISTGLRGGPPSGAYRPQRLERKWYSRKFDWAPMPHAIFFHEGYAIHGTPHVARLGRRASHGCVRLHPANAAQLFALVKEHGMGNTRIVVGSGMQAQPKKSRQRVAEIHPRDRWQR